jgi:hypothetical protein
VRRSLIAAYVQRKSAVSWNTDLTDDSLFFMVGKLADGITMLEGIYTLLLTLDKQVKEFFMEDNFRK